MLRMKRNFYGFHWAQFFKLAAICILLAGCLPTRSMAQEEGQKTFSSAEDASNSLVTAAQNNDEKALLDILGPDEKRIVSSGDETEDAQNRANFVQKYQEMHRLVKEPDGTTTLYIGAENWPTPIPLVNKGNSWYFDTDAGKKEILYRRLGRNELSTIRVCQELAAAEKEYYSTHHSEYAQKIFSDEGQHDGLYWKPANGETKSPIGPLVASAVAEGHVKSRNEAPNPYRGYYYHILTSQGENAPGGAKSYIANGKMTEGFAFVAYPAEYRSSGVMTFVVNEKGVVYQKDLGKQTAVLAKAMKEYNPDSSWQKAEDEQVTGWHAKNQVKKFLSLLGLAKNSPASSDETCRFFPESKLTHKLTGEFRAPALPAITFPARRPESRRDSGCASVRISDCSSIQKGAPTWAYRPIRETEHREQSEELQ